MQSPQATLAPKALFIRKFPASLKRDLTRAATINGETFREAVIRACEVELQKLNRKISKASLAIAIAELGDSR